MKRPFQNQCGFTFIEVIMAIVIVSIISVLAGMGLVQITNAYVFAKKNAVAAEQAQITLTRLTKEFSAIQSISAATATSMTYKRWDETSHTYKSYTLAWSGADQRIMLGEDIMDKDILMDKVTSFSLSYYNINPGSPPFAMTPVIINQKTAAVIEMTITVNVYANTPLTFVDRVVI
jgi:prepilin-type N-terminal cleavage/methylation domain-containing protein